MRNVVKVNTHNGPFTSTSRNSKDSTLSSIKRTLPLILHLRTPKRLPPSRRILLIRNSQQAIGERIINKHRQQLISRLPQSIRIPLQQHSLHVRPESEANALVDLVVDGFVFFVVFAFGFESFWCDGLVYCYCWGSGARALLLFVADFAVGLGEAVESHSGHDDAGDGVFVFGLGVGGDCGFWGGFDWDSGEALHAAEG
jgi:hypothetical protein